MSSSHLSHRPLHPCIVCVQSPSTLSDCVVVNNLIAVTDDPMKVSDNSHRAYLCTHLHYWLFSQIHNIPPPGCPWLSVCIPCTYHIINPSLLPRVQYNPHQWAATCSFLRMHLTSPGMRSPPFSPRVDCIINRHSIHLPHLQSFVSTSCLIRSREAAMKFSEHTCVDHTRDHSSTRISLILTQLHI